MKKKIMLVGATHTGKFELAKLLNADECVLKRQNNIVYDDKTLRIPGAYLECPWMYQHLIASAQHAYCLLFVTNLTEKRCVYPPNFAMSFQMPVYGVIVVPADLENHKHALEQARTRLAYANVTTPYFVIHLKDLKGLTALKNQIKNLEGGA